MATWADYSFARPSLSELKAKGVAGLFRYLAPLPNKKVIDIPERDAILGIGFDLVLNWEWYEGRCNEGGSAGRQDATEAVRQANALGYPAGACIYFSHDTGANDWQAIEAYFTQAGAVVHAAGYTMGAYGSFSVIQFLHGNGLIDYGWQTKAWSVGARSEFALVYQDGTALVAGTDNDIVSSADIGSWLGGKMAVSLNADDRAWLAGQFKHILDDLSGTKLRIADDDPIIKDLDTRLASLQAAFDKFTASGGTSAIPVDAKAVVDEMGRRLNVGA